MLAKKRVCANLLAAPPQRCPDNRPVIGHLIFYGFYDQLQVSNPLPIHAKYRSYDHIHDRQSNAESLQQS